jgi:hypothetical protein
VWWVPVPAEISPCAGRGFRRPRCGALTARDDAMPVRPSLARWAALRAVLAGVVPTACPAGRAFFGGFGFAG